MKQFFQFLSLSLLAMLPAGANQPHPWQLGFQEAGTTLMQRVNALHNLVLYIIFGIGIFVIIMTAYIMWRYQEHKNPVPSKITHMPWLEVVWTVIPFLLLCVIAVPSFKLMFYADKVADPEMTVKVIGHSWYWEYEYPDHQVRFDSNMVADEELQPGQLRLLDVDNQVVLPINTNIRIHVTSADVLHSWAIPAFGIKKDCVPGRLNELWIRIEKEGTYYGQCSELCGARHGFMPIVVRAVSKDTFEKWLTSAKSKYAMIKYDKI